MKCVKCGRTMVVRTGKSGKFYGCPGYPQCKSTAPYKEVRTPQVRVQREWSNFQLDIFDAVGRSNDNLLVEATAGSGKCLGKDTPVLMFDGSIKPVQDVSVGDMLMGDDSTPRTVLSTTVGNGELYKITPVKGDPFICNDVHVLSLSGTNKHMGEVIDIPLNKTTDRTHRDWKLYRVGVEFQYKPVPIDPYVVGVWLGDGAFDSQQVCNPEPEILEYMKEYAKSIGGMTSVAERVGDEENGLKYISIIFGGKHQFNSNPFRTYILNSCRNGRDKVVPEELKINSREVRLSVLAGLLDTDGYYSHKHYTIVTKYTTLRDDISFIARSLGFSAYWSERKVRLPDWDDPRTYYSVSISGDLSEIPCRVPRKKAEPRNQIKRTTVTGWKKEPIGVGDYYGFTLDGNGRFLLGDFTVTHNTSTSVEALNYATRYSKVAFVAFNRSIAQDFKAKVPDGVHASTYHALGLKSIMQSRGNEVKVEETKNFKLFTQFTDQMSEVFKSTATDYRSEILRLVGLAKNVMLDVTGTESFRTLADEYGIDIGDDTESGLVLDLAFKVYKASVEDNSTIDFDDMIHWCATGKVEPLAFDFVVTDECLPYKTPVLLADGTSMTIGEMVDSRFDGSVLTYNEMTGLQEPKKVIGWHKIPNKKRLYEITVGWNKWYGEKNTITCTEDHKILTGHGWTVAEKVIVGDIVQMHTLNLGHVLSIAEVTLDDSWVYDITVEDNHNFYANGILVHNCQDMNASRTAMLLAMVRNGGRSMMVGDRRQTLYRWSGSTEGVMDILKQATNARELPLSITYRCPVSHVELAQKIVPQIQARPNAPQGIIGNLKPWELTRFVRDGDMVMCRTNAPLVKPAFEMLSQGKKAIIVGRDIGANLVNLVDRVARKSGVTGTNQMLDELEKYVDMQVYRLEKTGKLAKAEMMKDQLETVIAISDGCETVKEVSAKITGIFSDDRDGVSFTSVHRGKGREAERTFILHPELMPHPMAKNDPVALREEENVLYVAITRSKSEMYFVA